MSKVFFAICFEAISNQFGFGFFGGILINLQVSGLAQLLIPFRKYFSALFYPLHVSPNKEVTTRINNIAYYHLFIIDVLFAFDHIFPDDGWDGG